MTFLLIFLDFGAYRKRGTAPGVIAVIVFVSMMMVIIPWFVWRRRMARLGFEWNMRPRPSRRDIYASTLSTHPAFMEPYPVASPGGYRRSSRGAPLAPLPSLTTTYSWSSEKHLSDEGGGVPECPICYEDMTGRTTVGAPCGHLLCRSCRELVVDTAARNGERAKCHACRAPYT